MVVLALLEERFGKSHALKARESCISLPRQPLPICQTIVELISRFAGFSH